MSAHSSAYARISSLTGLRLIPHSTSSRWP